MDEGKQSHEDEDSNEKENLSPLHCPALNESSLSSESIIGMPPISPFPSASFFLESNIPFLTLDNTKDQSSVTKNTGKNNSYIPQNKISRFQLASFDENQTLPKLELHQRYEPMGSENADIVINPLPSTQSFLSNPLKSPPYFTSDEPNILLTTRPPLIGQSENDTSSQLVLFSSPDLNGGQTDHTSSSSDTLSRRVRKILENDALVSNHLALPSVQVDKNTSLIDLISKEDDFALKKLPPPPIEFQCSMQNEADKSNKSDIDNIIDLSQTDDSTNSNNLSDQRAASPTSVSSKLEWDSAADVGYSASNISQNGRIDLEFYSRSEPEGGSIQKGLLPLPTLPQVQQLVLTSSNNVSIQTDLAFLLKDAEAQTSFSKQSHASSSSLGSTSSHSTIKFNREVSNKKTTEYAFEKDPNDKDIFFENTQLTNANLSKETLSLQNNIKSQMFKSKSLNDISLGLKKSQTPLTFTSNIHLGQNFYSHNNDNEILLTSKSNNFCPSDSCNQDVLHNNFSQQYKCEPSNNLLQNYYHETFKTLIETHEMSPKPSFTEKCNINPYLINMPNSHPLSEQIEQGLGNSKFTQTSSSFLKAHKSFPLQEVSKLNGSIPCLSSELKNLALDGQESDHLHLIFSKLPFKKDHQSSLDYITSLSAACLPQSTHHVGTSKKIPLQKEVSSSNSYISSEEGDTSTKENNDNTTPSNNRKETKSLENFRKRTKYISGLKKRSQKHANDHQSTSYSNLNLPYFRTNKPSGETSIQQKNPNDLLYFKSHMKRFSSTNFKECLPKTFKISPELDTPSSEFTTPSQVATDHSAKIHLAKSSDYEETSSLSKPSLSTPQNHCKSSFSSKTLRAKLSSPKVSTKRDISPQLAITSELKKLQKLIYQQRKSYINHLLREYKRMRSLELKHNKHFAKPLTEKITSSSLSDISPKTSQEGILSHQKKSFTRRTSTFNQANTLVKTKHMNQANNTSGDNSELSSFKIYQKKNSARDFSQMYPTPPPSERYAHHKNCASKGVQAHPLEEIQNVDLPLHSKLVSRFPKQGSKRGKSKQTSLYWNIPSFGPPKDHNLSQSFSFTLQEAFILNRPHLIRRSKERENYVKRRAQKRIETVTHQENIPFFSPDKTQPKEPLKDITENSNKKIISLLDMKAQTERRYKNLNEVIKKKEQAKRKEEYNSFRQAAYLFTKSLQRHALNGKVTFGLTPIMKIRMQN